MGFLSPHEPVLGEYVRDTLFIKAIILQDRVK